MQLSIHMALPIHACGESASVPHPPLPQKHGNTHNSHLNAFMNGGVALRTTPRMNCKQKHSVTVARTTGRPGTGDELHCNSRAKQACTPGIIATTAQNALTCSFFLLISLLFHLVRKISHHSSNMLQRLIEWNWIENRGPFSQSPFFRLEKKHTHTHTSKHRKISK